MIGAAIGLAASVAGGIMGNAAARKQQRAMREAHQRKLNDLTRRYNENGLQRASAQAMLNRVQEDISRRNQEAKGQQAVMGGSEASVAATKEANAQALANTASNIVANEDARKDAIKNKMDEENSQFEQQQIQMEAQKSQALASAISGAGGAMGSLTQGAMKFGGKKEQ